MKQNFEHFSIIDKKISPIDSRRVEIFIFLFPQDFWYTLYIKMLKKTIRFTFELRGPYISIISCNSIISLKVGHGHAKFCIWQFDNETYHLLLKWLSFSKYSSRPSIVSGNHMLCIKYIENLNYYFLNEWYSCAL